MVKDHVSEALELFGSGYNCSQSVLASFSEELGFTRETALKIACPFGGGFGGQHRTCGALTGAVMALGLKYDTSKITNLEAKNLLREKTRALFETFEKAHGTSICNDLVGFDMNKLNGAELKEKFQYFQNTCPKFLETVIAFLEEEL